MRVRGSDQWNFDLPVVFETWIAAKGCSLAEKILTSGDAWGSDTVVRTDLCGGIVELSDTLTMLTNAYS